MKFRFKLFLFLSYFGIFFTPVFSSAITVEITALVPGCGDGIVSVGEQCDSGNLNGASCVTQGFGSGTLSCTLACTFNTSQCVVAGPGGGGGGGGGGNIPPPVIIPNTNVVFSGRAYPLSRVSILKDGQLAVTTIAGPDSNFSVTISNLSTGNYTFAVYGEDKNNVRSSLFTFPIFISSGVTTKIGGIFIAPTIGVDKSEVRRGDTISIFGQSVPLSEVTISVHSEVEHFVKRQSDETGAYLLNFDTSILEMGQHATKSKVAKEGEISPFGTIVNFAVGLKNVLAEVPTVLGIKADLNTDKRVNLVDFSIAAYWYKRANPPVIADLNQDGKVDLVDFSILAFYWTG
jgi:hypothetical protein